MSVILNDAEIKKLIGTVIVNGDATCVRPNTYTLRLGSKGEFINTSKEFELAPTTKKKGIRIQRGHSVGVTSFETLDFRRETVHKIYPNCDLHALLSPTTDLSREGVVAPTTQVDAGYHGTLNWTLTNTSSEERKFVHEERIYRAIFFKLENGEVPEKIYAGAYQSKTGYVRSQRPGPAVGMKDSEWEGAFSEDGPEHILDDLMKSGYPWHILGSRLKEIDNQFKTVTDEYGNIQYSISALAGSVDALKAQQEKYAPTQDVVNEIKAELLSVKAQIPDIVRSILREEAVSLKNGWIVSSAALFATMFGLWLTVSSNSQAMQFVKDNGSIIGLIVLLVSLGVLIYYGRRK